MKNLSEVLRRFKEVSLKGSDEDENFDNLALIDDATDELRFLVSDLRDCLRIIDVDDPNDTDFLKYRRRDLVRRIRHIINE